MTFRDNLTDADRDYVTAVAAALRNGANLILWLTPRCPECNEIPRHNDGLHAVIVGHVLIGCEGHYVVNPNAVGIDSPDWQDWREF